MLNRVREPRLCIRRRWLSLAARETRSARSPAVQLLVGGLLLIGIWVLLPARYWPIDVLGSALALLQIGAAAGLLARCTLGRAGSR